MTEGISALQEGTSLRTKMVLLTPPPSPAHSVHLAPLPIRFLLFILSFILRSLSQLWQVNRGLSAFNVAARFLHSQEQGKCVRGTCSCWGICTTTAMPSEEPGEGGDRVKRANLTRQRLHIIHRQAHLNMSGTLTWLRSKKKKKIVMRIWGGQKCLFLFL